MRRDHVLVLGGPGCGKTPFAASLVEGDGGASAFGFHAAARRVLYFDPTGEWGRWGERVRARDLADPRTLAGTFLRVVVEPSDDALVPDFLATVAAARAAAPHGGLALVVDEVGDLSDGGAAGELRALHRNGHKDGIASVLVSPSWTDIPARCRATASRVYCFFQRADADVRALDAELGRQVPGFGRLAAEWRFPAPPIEWRSPSLHP